MDEPSDHLLRTFGAIPVASRVLDLGCGDGAHADSLVRLGFDVYACDGRPDAVERTRLRLARVIGVDEARHRCVASKLHDLGLDDEFFDWIVAAEVLGRIETRSKMLEALAESRRTLKTGGWLYISVPSVSDDELVDHLHGYAGDSALKPTFTPRTLDELMHEAGFVTAERPSFATEGERRQVRGIYRKIDSHTPV